MRHGAQGVTAQHRHLRHQRPEDGVRQPGAHAQQPREEDDRRGGAEGEGDEAQGVGDQASCADVEVGHLQVPGHRPQ